MADSIMVQVDDVERPATPAEVKRITLVQDFMAEQPVIGAE